MQPSDLNLFFYKFAAAVILLLPPTAFSADLNPTFNGSEIEAQADIYGATGAPDTLNTAAAAAEWMIKNRSLPGGGFDVRGIEQPGRHLIDTLAMGRAALALYSVTGERRWLTVAQNAASYITANFRSGDKMHPGFISNIPVPGSSVSPERSAAENISTVRFLNLLSHYTGNSKLKDEARSGMDFLSSTEAGLDAGAKAELAEAKNELAADPLHIVAVGERSDPNTQALYKAGVRFRHPYKRVELFDRSESPPPNPELQYPVLNRASAYVCSNKRCSLPIFDPAEIPYAITTLSGK